MAGTTPARRTSELFQQGRLPLSPLGATPRPPLRQVYPKVSFLSQSELNTSIEGEYSQVKRTTKTSYTLLRASGNGTDSVDSLEAPDYDAIPAGVGSSTKFIIILGLIFFLSLVALGWVYSGVANSKE